MKKKKPSKKKLNKITKSNEISNENSTENLIDEVALEIISRRLKGEKISEYPEILKDL
ncbi:MAG: hypothetical protein KDK36_09260 [Leptospiraceae bacterium]|nr:hypothetical protein [Leptospiraceae bacterium]